MWRRFFPSLLIALLLLGGVAWAQGQGNLQDQGQQRPLQSNLVNQAPQPLDLSIDRHNSPDKNPKAAKVTDINQNNARGNLKNKSIGPSFTRYEIFNDKIKGPQVNVFQSGLIGSYPSSLGSKSFFDGYLLRSLHADGYSSKKPEIKKKPNDDLPLKRKTFIK